jgi:hypothetical protein
MSYLITLRVSQNKKGEKTGANLYMKGKPMALGLYHTFHPIVSVPNLKPLQLTQ